MVITTIITFIIIFSLLIFLHELGHFWTARKFGVKVEEFGFGLPPRMGGIYKKDGKWKFVRAGKEAKTKGTIYSLNWIPVGGFVKLLGEDGSHSEEKGSFSSASPLKRAIILTAGVAMNVLLTIVLMSVSFISGTPSVIDDNISSKAIIREDKIQVINILPDSPADKADITVGSAILSVDKDPIELIDKFQAKTNNTTGKSVLVEFETPEGEVKEVEVTPAILPEGEGKAIIGVSLLRTGIVSYPWYLAIPEGARATGMMAVSLLKAFGGIIRNLISTGQAGAIISGPVGIAVLTGQVVQLGFIYVIQFAATLSLNLAIINYLPVPALDGGRVLFILIEKLRGKAVDSKIEGISHTIGFALLMLLILVITFKDIARYGETILRTFKNVLFG